MGGRELLRELRPRETIERESALGIRELPYPSIFEDLGFISFSKLLDIRHTIPELRFTQLDQTDPNGRGRWYTDGTSTKFQRALTANWATVSDIVQFDLTGAASPGRALFNGGRVQLGDAATTATDLWMRTEATMRPGDNGTAGLNFSGLNNALVASVALIVGNASGHPMAINAPYIEVVGKFFVTGTGAASQPGIAAKGDTNTGILWSAADTLSYIANALIRFQADATGIGFFAVTPVARASAYTQTFATADKTHATPTVGTDIAAFTDPPTAAEMATLRTFVNALKADHADLAQLVNAVIDDGQAYGLFQ